MDINKIQDEIIEDFSMLPDWNAKYEYLMDMENSLPDMDNAYKTNEHLVHGCNSKAWITAELTNNNVHFIADGETAIARGILALMLKLFNNRAPDEIMETELYFFDRIGLKENLSMTRAEGLEHLIEKIYTLARSMKEASDQHN